MAVVPEAVVGLVTLWTAELNTTRHEFVVAGQKRGTTLGAGAGLQVPQWIVAGLAPHCSNTPVNPLGHPPQLIGETR